MEPGADALAAIRAALPKDTADDVYKIILTGESFAAPDLAYLRQALERDFFALTFSDETVPPRDLWRRAGEDSLAGRFLRRMQRRIETAETEEQRKCSCAPYAAALPRSKVGRCGCDRAENDGELRRAAKPHA